MKQSNNQTILFVILLFALIGLVDASYLTYEHYSNFIPPCTTGFAFIDCGKVLKSVYSQIGGVPVAVLGMIHYAVFALWVVLNILKKNKYSWLILAQASIGLLSSIAFVFLQLAVIKAICFYCMISAINSLVLCGTSVIYSKNKSHEISSL